MAAPKGTIVPRGEDGHGVAARVTRHRFRAIVDDVLSGLLGAGAAVDAKGDDLVTRLRRECLSADRTSTAALEALLRLVPADTAASAPAGASINFNALYLQATQMAQPPAIDHEAQSPGYIAGTEAPKPLETLNDW